MKNSGLLSIFHFPLNTGQRGKRCCGTNEASNAVCSNASLPPANSFPRPRRFTKFHATCHLQASLAIIINIYGYNHRSVADTLNNMGGVRYAQKSWESALETYQQALDIANSVLGDKHPDVAATLRHACQKSPENSIKEPYVAQKRPNGIGMLMYACQQSPAKGPCNT